MGTAWTIGGSKGHVSKIAKVSRNKSPSTEIPIDGSGLISLGKEESGHRGSLQMPDETTTGHNFALFSKFHGSYNIPSTNESGRKPTDFFPK